ncbi:ABC transporter substrate-binding protein [Rhodococcus tukisamuensis]|uniref:Iron complex transport system substrate-binding protein n=1 Tax=Rhodococcus tukisamuensis TaxID=168276 RepID=A0A1G6MG65_9NOCA|nr:ABC transporter substrate-binding protein [Rhodococcus tukisamuensis]SDC54608.1 iron complex transport system substrate-binding protein [Rhodococcus tukisamuensis]
MSPRVISSTALSIAAALTLSACGGSSDSDGDTAAISLQNCGRAVTLDGPAERGVTLNQGATETALSIGAQDRMAGTAYLDDTIAPQWASAYAQVPALDEKDYPSREALLEVKPDLVLASYSSAFDDKAVGSHESFDALGVATYVSPFGCKDKSTRPAVSWDSIGTEITDHGTLFGRESEADAVVAQMRETLSGIEAAAPAKGKSIFWYDSNTDTPHVGGNAGGPQLIIDAVGGTNIFANANGAWLDGSWETVLAANPDVIVLADASWDTAEEKKNYMRSDPALKDLKAVRDDAFVVVPFSASTPGPRTIEGASLVAKQLGGNGA